MQAGTKREKNEKFSFSAEFDDKTISPSNIHSNNFNSNI